MVHASKNVKMVKDSGIINVFLVLKIVNNVTNINVTNAQMNLFCKIVNVFLSVILNIIWTKSKNSVRFALEIARHVVKQDFV